MSELREVGLRELSRIRGELDALFERTLHGPDLIHSPTSEAWSPPVDVAETQEAYHLTFELPGIERDDIDLTVDQRTLVLAGCRGREGESRRFLRMERAHGVFRREIEFAAELDPDGIEARLAQGLLAVRVAKKRPRRVEVHSAGAGK